MAFDTILVTGGAGFIGSNFVRRWLAEPTSALLNLDKLTYAGNLDSLADVWGDERHTFLEGDIADRPRVDSLLAERRPRAIVHFAAESHVDRSIDAPMAFVQTNVVGTVNILQAALAYWRGLAPAEQATFRFLHVSTDEVYGSLDAAGRFTEQSPYAPNSPYAASKAASDHFVRAFHHTYGLPTIVTHCSNNYGPYQFPEKLIPLMILNAVEGRPLPVYGTGRNVRDWLFVDDHCRALQIVLAEGIPGEEYNIGGDCERANLDVVQHVCGVVDRLCPQLPHAPTHSLITFVPDRPGHDLRYAIDATKIRTTLGWTPRESFDSGIERTVRWYLNNLTWVKRMSGGMDRREAGEWLGGNG